MKHLLSNISMMPSVDELRKRLQSLAMLDAILMPDWDLRYFSFNSGWGNNEMLSSMKDGEGSEFFFLFNEMGVIGKICYKGKLLGPYAVLALAKLPKEFSSFLNEPAFNIDNATCYLWQHSVKNIWSIVPENIIGIPFMAFVGDQGEYYCSWAENYYEKEFNMESIKSIFRMECLTKELVSSLNPDVTIESILSDSQEIGYPISLASRH